MSCDCRYNDSPDLDQRWQTDEKNLSQYTNIENVCPSLTNSVFVRASERF